MRWKHLGDRKLETYLTLSPPVGPLVSFNPFINQLLIFNEQVVVNIDIAQQINQTLIFTDQVAKNIDNAEQINQALIFADQANFENIKSISQTITFMNTIDFEATFNRSILQSLNFNQDAVGFSVKAVDQALTFTDVATEDKIVFFLPVKHRRKYRISRFPYYRRKQRPAIPVDTETQAATGTFNITTQAAGNTVSVNNLPFRPKVVIFSWSGRTAVGQAEGHHKFGMGYGVSTSDRGGYTSQSEDSAVTMSADSQVFDDACIKTLTTTGTLDGAADFVSFNSDGFTVVIDDQFAADYLIHYLALGGGGIEAVASTTLSFSATGDTNVTSLSFKPKCALLFGASTGAVNSTTGSSLGSFGVAAGATPNNYVLAGSSQDGVANAVTCCYCTAGESYARALTDTVTDRGSITAWLSNGFTWSCTEASGSTCNVRVLCLKTNNVHAGDILTSTGSSNFSETGIAVSPKCLVFASHFLTDTEHTQNVTEPNDRRSIGFAVSPSSRNYISIIDKDTESQSDIGVADNTDACYASQNTAATVIIIGLMDLVSLDSGGFTVVMDDPDPVAFFVWYLAVGNGS